MRLQLPRRGMPPPVGPCSPVDERLAPGAFHRLHLIMQLRAIGSSDDEARLTLFDAAPAPLCAPDQTGHDSASLAYALADVYNWLTAHPMSDDRAAVASAPSSPPLNSTAVSPDASSMNVLPLAPRARTSLLRRPRASALLPG
mmetsp:Transcript_61470/g.136934  ORF Transcript_61470/g.136934 Transcript_61470/m.136934 type:complete len:143 (-) Transcript_61470:266-694(-)